MPSEIEITIAGKRDARDRLVRAMAGEARTRHLPPGDEDRDNALLELTDAKALAQEWEA